MKTIHINNQLFLERIVNYNFNNLGVFIPLEFINSLNDLTSNILNNNDSLLNDYLEMFYYYEQNISNNIYLTESNKEFLDLINNVFIVFYKYFNIEKQITNPILPNFEYTPDIEPKVFNDRVYLYGSHDKFNGNSFCINDYITYSASINDLTKWRYEGIIYKRASDPNYRKGRMSAMFAPDVIKGLDNKYYLYYHRGFSGRIGVAVSDKPNTMFSFLGYVKYSDGSLLGSKKEPLQFDPGIFIDDDNKIYLYTGFAPKKFNLFLLKNKKTTKEGAMVFELESDMLTIKTNFKYIAKTVFNSTNSSFYGHEFFEAASMRKIDDTY